MNTRNEISIIMGTIGAATNGLIDHQHTQEQ